MEASLVTSRTIIAGNVMCYHVLPLALACKVGKQRASRLYSELPATAISPLQFSFINTYIYKYIVGNNGYDVTRSGRGRFKAHGQYLTGRTDDRLPTNLHRTRRTRSA
jgi:hypothetical protein